MHVLYLTIKLIIIFNIFYFVHSNSQECMWNGQKYRIGEMWNDPSECSMRQCKEVAIKEARNLTFALPVKFVCAGLDRTDSKCTLLHEENKLSFPECCSMQICIINDKVEILKSSLPNTDIKQSPMRKSRRKQYVLRPLAP